MVLLKTCGKNVGCSAKIKKIQTIQKERPNERKGQIATHKGHALQVLRDATSQGLTCASEEHTLRIFK